MSGVKFQLRLLKCLILIVVSVLTLVVVDDKPASAQLGFGPCFDLVNRNSGYLCFVDYAANGRHDLDTYGGVSGNNAWWGNFGWNDRADSFYNNGRSCMAFIHENINFAGWYWGLRIGVGLYGWHDAVSSNDWRC